MARPAPQELDDVETITLPRGVRFPVELDPPPGFNHVVVTRADESCHGRGERLPPHPNLPDLAPTVDDLFVQISEIP